MRWAEGREERIMKNGGWGRIDSENGTQGKQWNKKTSPLLERKKKIRNV